MAACAVPPSGPQPEAPPQEALAQITISLPLSRLAIGSQIVVGRRAVGDAGTELVVPALTWTSDAPEVADIDSSGTLTAFSVGTTQLQAFSNGVVSNTVDLEVYQPDGNASLRLVPSEFSLGVGTSLTLDVVARDAEGNRVPISGVTLASDASGVAQVDTQGGVIGVTTGDAVVTATLPTGETAVASVSVLDTGTFYEARVIAPSGSIQSDASFDLQVEYVSIDARSTTRFPTSVAPDASELLIGGTSHQTLGTEPVTSARVDTSGLAPGDYQVRVRATFGAIVKLSESFTVRVIHTQTNNGWTRLSDRLDGNASGRARLYEHNAALYVSYLSNGTVHFKRYTSTSGWEPLATQVFNDPEATEPRESQGVNVFEWRSNRWQSNSPGNGNAAWDGDDVPVVAYHERGPARPPGPNDTQQPPYLNDIHVRRFTGATWSDMGSVPLDPDRTFDCVHPHPVLRGGTLWVFFTCENRMTFRWDLYAIAHSDSTWSAPLAAGVSSINPLTLSQAFDTVEGVILLAEEPIGRNRLYRFDGTFTDQTPDTIELLAATLQPSGLVAGVAWTQEDLRAMVSASGAWTHLGPVLDRMPDAQAREAVIAAGSGNMLAVAHTEGDPGDVHVAVWDPIQSLWAPIADTLEDAIDLDPQVLDIMYRNNGDIVVIWNEWNRGNRGDLRAAFFSP